jgi:hypothetical protein
MAQFLIEIAGYTGRIDSLFESTRDYCRKYLTESEADFSVTVTREDLDFEQEALRLEALEEGIKVRKFTDPFLERAAIQRKTAEFLFDRDVLMTHGSTVAVDGKAYLFTAACGTGKSTHTRFWRQVFGDRAVMVNDDKPFLRISADGVLACGAPWSGKHGLDTNIAVPLQGICILERGSENRIVPATAAQREFLLTQRHRPEDPEKDRLSAALTEALMDRVPVWYMTCTKDPDAPLVSRRAMASY